MIVPVTVSRPSFASCYPWASHSTKLAPVVIIAFAGALNITVNVTDVLAVTVAVSVTARYRRCCITATASATVGAALLLPLALPLPSVLHYCYRYRYRRCCITATATATVGAAVLLPLPLLSVLHYSHCYYLSLARRYQAINGAGVVTVATRSFGQERAAGEASCGELCATGAMSRISQAAFFVQVCQALG